jgi:hypothetical protein
MATMRTLRNNGLSIVLTLLFMATLAGQAYAGYRAENAERRDHNERPETFGEYLRSPEMLEATMENWESEFFQMGIYVMLTVILFQKGSVESKDPEETKEEVDREPDPNRKDAPWPVKKGGFVLALYKRSLSIAFIVLFATSFIAHAAGGAGVLNAENEEHGDPDRVTVFSYMKTSRFWFESLQNWQSEFLAVLSIVVLSIWLRQQGSPESKPVDAAHSETGE